ncbi:hypothetical protein TNCV_4218461 [Trichonephila clavipes]|nr:hypothetical protein TNCV_4218461 [Trichonephila clavipes]
MLNLKRGKGFQKSAANPLLKTLLEGRKIRAVHFRSISSRAEKSVLSIGGLMNRITVANHFVELKEKQALRSYVILWETSSLIACNNRL